jgi:hypothetical protein
MFTSGMRYRCTQDDEVQVKLIVDRAIKKLLKIQKPESENN